MQHLQIVSSTFRLNLDNYLIAHYIDKGFSRRIEINRLINACHFIMTFNFMTEHDGIIAYFCYYTNSDLMKKINVN